MEWRNLSSQWEANQHIWSHWKPESTYTWSSLIQSHPLSERTSASEWQHSQTTSTAQIQLADSRPPPAACPTQTGAQGHFHNGTTAAPRSCRSSTNHGHFSTGVETCRCFSMPDHAHTIACVFTGCFVV